jgi:hypothetical protein
MVPSCQAGKHVTGDETVLSVKGVLSGFFVSVSGNSQQETKKHKF